MRMIIICLWLVGCSQAQPAPKAKEEPKVYQLLAKTKELDIKALEQRLGAIELALSRMETQMRVSVDDRNEVIAFNQCKQWCEQKYPYPEFDKKAGVPWEEWNEIPSVHKAQENTRKCHQECDKRKPKAQPDWSC